MTHKLAIEWLGESHTDQIDNFSEALAAAQRHCDQHGYSEDHIATASAIFADIAFENWHNEPDNWLLRQVTQEEKPMPDWEQAGVEWVRQRSRRMLTFASFREKEAIRLEGRIFRLLSTLGFATKWELELLRHLLDQQDAKDRLKGYDEQEKQWFRATQELIDHHLLTWEQQDT